MCECKSATKIHNALKCAWTNSIDGKKKKKNSIILARRRRIFHFVDSLSSSAFFTWKMYKVFAFRIKSFHDATFSQHSYTPISIFFKLTLFIINFYYYTNYYFYCSVALLALLKIMFFGINECWMRMRDLM